MESGNPTHLKINHSYVSPRQVCLELNVICNKSQVTDVDSVGNGGR